MLDKLEGLADRYDELEGLLASPELYEDPSRAAALAKEQSELQPIVTAYRRYSAACQEEQDARELLEEAGSDAELRALAQETLATSRAEIEQLEEELNDSRSVIMEIRAGAGGEEAALFAASLYRMYTMYADSRGWKTERIGQSETELGGFKEITFSIDGDGAFSRLKYESGVHRVQRVPETESQGRVHTSTVTVAVLPEVDDVELTIDPKDLRIDTFRSSGAGGQHINKTSSAIRVTHLPTGMVVECQDERSQFKNKDKALRVLRSRLFEIEQRKRDDAIAAERRSQVGTGDRSERIRTYNFPENRVSEHRIKLTLYKLDSFLDGNLDEVLDALITTDQAENLAKVDRFSLQKEKLGKRNV